MKRGNMSGGFTTIMKIENRNGNAISILPK